MTHDNVRLSFWYGKEEKGASAEEIARAETHIGHAFPASFRRLLFEQDGGVSSYSAYQAGERDVSLPAFFSLSTLVSSFDVADVFGTPKNVIAIASSGHSWLGLDYRAGGVPSVVYQETEDDEIESLATSFDEFLVGLVRE
jgi:hypothetical protein